MDEERGSCSHCGHGRDRDHRDDGDGSSGGTHAEEPPGDRANQYVRDLEQKVRRLEAAAVGERPEAVVRALQVLEVRERGAGVTEAVGVGAGLGPGERALLREMCHVVWGKLEDAPNNHRT